MKSYYITKQMTIYTDAREQTAPSGRKFRLSAVINKTDEPEIWVESKKEYCYKTLVKFIFLDGNGFLCLHLDYHSKLEMLKLS
jgi:hypothetical protein